MKRALLLLILFALSAANQLSAQADSGALSKAVEQYRAALDTEDPAARREAFAQAQRQFEHVVNDPAKSNASPDLLTNWGNAALGADDVGTAMWAYRRALQLDPTNARAQANIVHIRAHLPAWVPKPDEGGVLDTFFFWRRTLSPAARAWVGALAFLLFVLLLGGWLVRGQSWMRWAALLPLFVWVLLVVVPYMESLSDSNEGVVVARDAMLRTADAAGAPPRFTTPLPGGTEVTVLEPRDEWTRVGLADGRDGWVRSSQLRTLP